MFKSNTLLKLSNFVDNLITLPKLNSTGASSGDVITFDGTNIVWEEPAGGGGSLIPLVTTFADCENTTSPIDIVTVTIPANTLAVGDIIVIEYNAKRRNNSGSPVTLRQRRLFNSTNYGTSATASIPNATVATNLTQSEQLIVKSVTGTTARLVGVNSAASSNIATILAKGHNFAIGATTNANGAVSETLGDFLSETLTITTDNTIILRAEWSVANANTWIIMQQAQAYIIKKAV